MINLNKTFILIIFLVVSNYLVAQPYNIGHTTITFNDNSRNRTIETEIYYPSIIDGEDVASAMGEFPVIVFGHGFLMSWSAYENFWQGLVPEGYIICFPTTEGGAGPNHGNFGEDIKFIANEMQNENTNTNSILFNAINSKTALMGHSMGGGASFLAAENNSNIHTLVNFAAAETNPSAISAAKNVTVPTLLFSGIDDCVTPPDEHQDIMYDSLINTNCKTQINIIGGSHCYFANNNFSCNLGETFCGSNSITRQEQHITTLDFLNIWLNYTLKENNTALTVFNDSLQISNRITNRQLCSPTNTSIKSVNKSSLNLFPNPSLNQLNLSLENTDFRGEVIIHNSLGAIISKKNIDNNNVVIDISKLANGNYQLSFINDKERISKPFIKK